MVHPVAQAVRVWLVYLREGDVDVEAFIEFFRHRLGLEYDADGQDVVDFLEGDVLGLHLVPDRVGGLDACLDFIFQSHLVELCANGVGKLLEHFIAAGLSRPVCR